MRRESESKIVYIISTSCPLAAVTTRAHLAELLPADVGAVLGMAGEFRGDLVHAGGEHRPHHRLSTCVNSRSPLNRRHVPASILPHNSSTSTRKVLA
jgi:hypothetical protein